LAKDAQQYVGGKKSNDLKVDNSTNKRFDEKK